MVNANKQDDDWVNREEMLLLVAVEAKLLVDEERLRRCGGMSERGIICKYHPYCLFLRPYVKPPMVQNPYRGV